MNTPETNNRESEAARRDGPELGAAPGSANPSLVEQWRFPLGPHMAELRIMSCEGDVIEPEDMDALYEISLLFKKQVMKRHQERLARTRDEQAKDSPSDADERPAPARKD